MIIALALLTINGFAQRKGHKKMDRENNSELRKEMTPKDIADLKSKKLTLKLDLTDVQQKQVHKLILEEATARQSYREANKPADGEKLSKEDIVKIQNLRLDKQIEMKREMKAILNAEQYAKFEKMKLRKHRKKGKRKKKE